MTDTFLTVVFRNPTKEEVYELAYHAKLSAISWSHALDERDKLAALAEPEPPVDGEVAELVNHLLKVAAEDESDGCTYDSAFTRRAAELLERLAPQPVPEGPTDEELLERWRSSDWLCSSAEFISIAHAILDRWGNLAAEG